MRLSLIARALFSRRPVHYRLKIDKDRCDRCGCCESYVADLLEAAETEDVLISEVNFKKLRPAIMQVVNCCHKRAITVEKVG